MTDIADRHFLPGVSFELNGETVPAKELAWAMYAACGCISGMHMITEDTVTESAAWQRMSGNSRMIKRDRDRGFTIKLVKIDDVAEAWKKTCTHTPKWGYQPVPTPTGQSWATTRRAKTLHLVPLVALDKEKAKELDREWVGDDGSWSRKVASACGKAVEPIPVWTRKWYRTDGKLECSHCLKIAQSQVSI